jgi:uncharacterized protein (TIGR04255 family)
MSASWEPVKEGHSIEVAAGSVNFSEPLNEVLWKRTLRLAEQVSRPAGLVDRATFNAFQLTFGGGNLSGGPNMAEGPVGNVVFRRLSIVENPTGAITHTVAEEFAVGRVALTYRTMMYTRWSAFRERLRTLLRPALEMSVQGAAIANVRLEYRDIFIFSGTPNDAATDDLLRKDSKFIAPHIFERSDLWHSHTGMFIPEPSAQKRLIQINIDANDVPSDSSSSRRAISILTAVQDNLDQADSDELENESNMGDIVADRFESLHAQSKTIFGQLVTPAVAKRVGLNQPETTA